MWAQTTASFTIWIKLLALEARAALLLRLLAPQGLDKL